MAPYEKLVAWKLCHELVLAVYRVTGRFPDNERFGLTAQARRSAAAAPINIAEGSAKKGARDYRRYLNNARGALAQLGYVLRLAHDLTMVNESDWQELENLRNRAGYMTWQLYKAISNAAKRTT